MLAFEDSWVPQIIFDLCSRSLSVSCLSCSLLSFPSTYPSLAGGQPDCTQIYDAGVCDATTNCTYFGTNCWSCPASTCTPPTTTTTTTTSTTTTTTSTTFTTTTALPVDCVVSQWTTMGICPVSCGGGSVLRMRSIVTLDQFGGVPCPSLNDSSPCNSQACPVNCAVSDWAASSSCSVSCGGGIQSQTRTVTTAAASGGASCPALSGMIACNSQGCPSQAIDCVVSAWVAVGSCSVSCANGTQSRTRYINTPATNGGQPCPVLNDIISCDMEACPVDCVVSDWVNSGSCSQSCTNTVSGATGVQSRTRSVVISAVGTGAACPSLSTTVQCNSQPCLAAVAVKHFTVPSLFNPSSVVMIVQH